MSTIMKFNFQLLTIIAFGLILSPLNARFILVQLKGKQNISNYYSDGRSKIEILIRLIIISTFYPKIIFVVSRLDDVPPLHSGWKEMTTDEGKSFYVDLANMKVQWERPIHGSINSNFKTLVSK